MKGITHLLGIAACAGLCSVLICADTRASTAVKVELEADWKNQYDDLNSQLHRREWFDAVAEQAFKKDALVLTSDRKPSDVVLRRTEALLEDLSTSIKADLRRAFEANAGAGAGRYSIPLAKSGYDVTHLDISKDMIETANTISMKEGVKEIRFIQGDICNMDVFQDREFDMTLCFDAPISYT